MEGTEMIVDNIENLRRIVGARGGPFEIKIGGDEALHFTPNYIYYTVRKGKRSKNIPFRPYFTNWSKRAETLEAFAESVTAYLNRPKMKIGPFPKMAPSMDGMTLTHNQSRYRPKSK